MAFVAGLNKPFVASPAARRRSVPSVSNSQRVMLPAVKAAANDNSINMPAVVSAFAASLVRPTQFNATPAVQFKYSNSVFLSCNLTTSNACCCPSKTLLLRWQLASFCPSWNLLAPQVDLALLCVLSCYCCSLQVLLTGAPAFAAPRTETDTVGAEETRAVVEKGTPGAAKLGELKTNMVNSHSMSMCIVHHLPVGDQVTETATVLISGEQHPKSCQLR
jgi:hypothetical protein